MKSSLFAICAPAAMIVGLASVPARAQASTDTFTGPRAEVTVGLDQLRFDLAEVDGSGRTKTSDLGYGAALGYDVAISPNLIAGIEGGVSLSDNQFTTATGSLRERRELTLAARAGTPIGDHALLYGKVGYANLQVRETDLVGSEKNNLDGVLLAAGAEVQITPRTYLKGEYRYTDYSDGYVGNNIMTGVGIRF